MNRHFAVLLVGSLVFVAVFLWRTAPMPAANFEGAQMVHLHVVRKGFRVIVPYGAFLIVLFGHHHLTRRVAAGRD